MSSFCSAKATHIFSAKNFRKLYIESAKIINEMALNELVKLTTLWTTGPLKQIALCTVITKTYLKFIHCGIKEAKVANVSLLSPVLHKLKKRKKKNNNKKTHYGIDTESKKLNIQNTQQWQLSGVLCPFQHYLGVISMKKMIWWFSLLSTLFKPYQGDGREIMKYFVQWMCIVMS